MATQDTAATAATTNNNNNNTYSRNQNIKLDFNYKDDEATFQRFLTEHQILVRDYNNNNHDDDDDDDEIPTAFDDTTNSRRSRVVRRICYQQHLRRIKNRHFYSDEELGSSNMNSNSDPSILQGRKTTTSFVVEIPLDELATWDPIKGKILADRAMNNTMRYQSVFSNAVDSVLDTMTTDDVVGGGGSGTGDGGVIRDTVDILHQQRLSIMEQNRAAAAASNNNNGGADAADIYARRGGVDDENDGTNNNNSNNNNNTNGATEDFPPILMRRYELRILPYQRRATFPPFVHQQHSSSLSSSENTLGEKRGNNTSSSTGPVPLSLRQIRSTSMGHLVTVSGMVVRSSDVKPSCQVATYSCDVCGAEIYQVLSLYHREFMPARVCPSCPNSSKSHVTTLFLQTRGSRLVKYQELKIQELPNQVPMGHIPRSLTVICRGELTRQATPGDVLTVDGVFLPQRVGGETGYKAMKAGLISTTYVEAQNIIVHKKSYDESLVDTLNEKECNEMDSAILAVATGPDPVGVLAASIAPEIFGHEDIKRALLLQLVGGCTRTLPDGMRIRGDINICLMGDPGVAKSQLLKHVAGIAPRGVYTTGKGSSGVGLTAAVTKDLATGDMTLEGGALVFADRGICCIDEFDKMEESDRTSIHEVMEQQTVSIAKAGIIATLNARTSVLAAANPLYGRYNPHKTLSENINLPNSLLSRFDLLFLILDVANVEKDMALAKHVTFVHQNEGVAATTTATDTFDNTTMGVDTNEDNPVTQGTNTSSAFTPNGTVSSLVLREYISRARRYQPVMSPDVAPYVVEAYVSLRMQQQKSGPGNRRRYRSNNTNPNNIYNNNSNSSSTSDQTVMTARQLLSILRFSQALARLRFSDYVAREDVDEAIRLTHMSKASLYDSLNDTYDGNGGTGTDGTGTGSKRRRTEDVTSRIFHIIRDYYTATISNTDDTSSSTKENGIELKLCESMILRKGFTIQQLEDCIQEYETLQIIQINRTRTHLYFID